MIYNDFIDPQGGAVNERFTVDGLIYEFSISNTNELFLAIVGGSSKTYQIPYDPFERWGYQPKIFGDIGRSRHPVTVLRKTLKRVLSWIGVQRPPYFSFVAESRKRESLYHRVAALLVRRFPYQMVEQKGVFYFYRLKDANYMK